MVMYYMNQTLKTSRLLLIFKMKIYPPFRKNPPKIMTGIMKVGANAKATFKFGAIQDII